MNVTEAKRSKMQGIVSEAQDRLDRILHRGNDRVQNALLDITEEFRVRKDIGLRPDQMGIAIDDITKKPVLEYSNKFHTLTPHSEQQLFSKTGVPANFYKKLVDNNLLDLADENLNEMNKKMNQDGLLIREVNGVVKGILSRSFKRMSAAPIFEAFVTYALREGYAPHRGFNTDYRYRLDFIYPEIIQLFPGEFIVKAISIMTGDYGNCKHKLDLGLLRIWCENLAVGYNLFGQIHLGSKFEIGEGIIEISKEAYEADDHATALAIRDCVVRSSSISDDFVEMVRTQASAEPNFELYLKDFKKKYGSELARQVKSKWESSMDIEYLPSEHNKWRLSNVLSLLAKEQSSDLEIDLQREAFSVLN